MKKSEQSKQWMQQAMFDLLKTKNYESITISDIANKAGVSRLTFYRNYEKKEDILVYHFQCGCKNLITWIQNEKTMNLRSILIMIFHFWLSRKSEIILLKERGLMGYLYDPFRDSLEKALGNADLHYEFTNVQKAFLIGGMFYSMKNWVESDCKEAPNQIADEIMDMFSFYI